MQIKAIRKLPMPVMKGRRASIDIMAPPASEIAPAMPRVYDHCAHRSEVRRQHVRERLARSPVRRTVPAAENVDDDSVRMSE